MQTFAWRTAYIAVLCAALLIFGLWHIVAGPMTERIFRDAGHVRAAGLGMLLAALPCIAWPKPYFVALGSILAVSGLLRAISPTFNIHLQKRTWPRWGHGCVIMSFAALAWISYVWGWLATH